MHANGGRVCNKELIIFKHFHIGRTQSGLASREGGGFFKVRSK